MIHPGIEFKPIKGKRLLAQRNFCEIGPDLHIELIAIHAEISRCIPVTDQARQYDGCLVHGIKGAMGGESVTLLDPCGSAIKKPTGQSRREAFS